MSLFSLNISKNAHDRQGVSYRDVSASSITCLLFFLHSYKLTYNVQQTLLFNTAVV